MTLFGLFHKRSRENGGYSAANSFLLELYLSRWQEWMFYFKTLFSITTKMDGYDTSNSPPELGRFKIYMATSKSISAINGLPIMFLWVYSCCLSIFNKWLGNHSAEHADTETGRAAKSRPCFYFHKAQYYCSHASLVWCVGKTN